MSGDAPKAEIVPHEHCAEGACESCDCCAAGWCVAFEDGDPYPQQFYGYSEPYSARLLADARDTFDLWASMVLDAWEVEARPLADVIQHHGRPAAQPRTRSRGGSDD